MRIDIPPKTEWHQYGNQLLQLIEEGCSEREVQAFLVANPWIHLVMFAQHYEGACFVEYDIGPEQRTDFLLVHGGSAPDVTLIELKSPNSEIFTKGGLMSKELNDGFSKTLNRMFAIHNDYEHYYNRLSGELEELLSGVRRPYQGVVHGDLRAHIHVPFIRFLHFHAKIVIGRDVGLRRNNRFRDGVASFTGNLAILTYDSILRTLMKFAPSESNSA